MKKNGKNMINRAGWLLFFLYIILLSYFLFFSERYSMKDYHYNLEFFKEIKRFILYRKQLGFETFIVNIVGNILAFAPFGFLLPLLDKKYCRFIYVTFLCFLFSLSVETMQLLLKVGIFDVDDIMMNTAGGILGYLSYYIFRGVMRPFLPKKAKK